MVWSWLDAGLASVRTPAAIHVERALRSAPESVEVHAAVLAMERQKVARSSPEQRVAKARAARTRLEAFKASFLKPRDLESPEDPVLAGEYRLTNVEVSLALDGPRSAQRIFQEKPWPSVLDHSMLGDRVALEAKVNAELGVSMPEALWDQLDRDPKQVAPVMAGMLRDQLSMADRLRQTLPRKPSSAACDAERDPLSFSHGSFPRRTLRLFGWNWWRMLGLS